MLESATLPAGSVYLSLISATSSSIHALIHSFPSTQQTQGTRMVMLWPRHVIRSISDCGSPIEQQMPRGALREQTRSGSRPLLIDTVHEAKGTPLIRAPLPHTGSPGGRTSRARFGKLTNLNQDPLVLPLSCVVLCDSPDRHHALSATP